MNTNEHGMTQMLDTNAKPQLTSPARSAQRHRSAGFSLVEILVVVAIILLLVGIGVAVSGAMQQRALGQQTKLALSELRSIASEYQTVTSLTVPYTANTLSGTSEDDSIKAFTAKAYEVPSCQPMFDRLRRDEMIGGAWPPASGGFTINDAWDKPIQYRSSSDGSVLRKSDHPFFASAGIDGAWGDVNGSDAAQEQARDNLYSLDVQ